MASEMLCAEGHRYILPDALDGLTSGEPVCPVCRVNQRATSTGWTRLTDEVILVGGRYYRGMTDAEIVKFEHQQEQFELRWS